MRFTSILLTVLATGCSPIQQAKQTKLDVTQKQAAAPILIRDVVCKSESGPGLISHPVEIIYHENRVDRTVAFGILKSSRDMKCDMAALKHVRQLSNNDPVVGDSYLVRCDCKQ